MSDRHSSQITNTSFFYQQPNCARSWRVKLVEISYTRSRPGKTHKANMIWVGMEANIECEPRSQFEGEDVEQVSPTV